MCACRAANAFRGVPDIDETRAGLVNLRDELCEDLVRRCTRLPAVLGLGLTVPPRPGISTDDRGGARGGFITAETWYRIAPPAMLASPAP